MKNLQLINKKYYHQNQFLQRANEQFKKIIEEFSLKELYMNKGAKENDLSFKYKLSDFIKRL